MAYSAYSCINMQNAGRFIVNLQHASGTDVLHDVVHGLLQVAVLADVLLHRIDGVHNGGMVTLEFGTDGFHAHTGDLADDIHAHVLPGLDDGVKTMDEALTKVINEGHARGLAEGQIKILVSLCRSGNISVEIAADQLKISTDEFRKYLDSDMTDY